MVHGRLLQLGVPVCETHSTVTLHAIVHVRLRLRRSFLRYGVTVTALWVSTSRERTVPVGCRLAFVTLSVEQRPSFDRSGRRETAEVTIYSYSGCSSQKLVHASSLVNIGW